MPRNSCRLLQKCRFCLWRCRSPNNWFACKLAGHCSEPDSAIGVYTVAQVKNTATWCAGHCSIADPGLADSDRGWYDAQCLGVKSDFCRNVSANGRTWFSCKLSGHCDIEYSQPGVYTAAAVRDTATWCAANKCNNCKNGVPGTGTSTTCANCKSCYAGYTLSTSTSTCVACPQGMTAPAGSVGSAACAVPSTGILGCYADCGAIPSKPVRVMTDKIITSLNKYTVCAKRCSGYFKYFGVENGNECYCSDSYGQQGASVSCTFPCPGYSGSTCGGPCAMTVAIVDKIVCRSDFYMDSTKNCIACPANTSSPVGSVLLADCKAISSDGMVAGCYLDCGSTLEYVADMRIALPGSSFNTHAACTAKCSAYKYFAVQNGYSCSCGNSYGSQGLTTGCSSPCTGDATQLCGAQCHNLVGGVALVCKCLNGTGGNAGTGCACTSCYKGYYLTTSKTCKACALGQTSVNSVCTIPSNGLRSI